MKKTFEVPVVWTMCDTLQIEADTIEDAIAKAQSMVLPKGHYLEDSFEVDIDEVCEAENAMETEAPSKVTRFTVVPTDSPDAIVDMLMALEYGTELLISTDFERDEDGNVDEETVGDSWGMTLVRRFDGYILLVGYFGGGYVAAFNACGDGCSEPTRSSIFDVVKFALNWAVESLYLNTREAVCANNALLGIVCKRCKSTVYATSIPGYKYQCFSCAEDLYAPEVTTQ